MIIKAAEAKPLAALDHYPIQEPVILDRNEVGIINDNWLVTDAGSERYVLRAYRRVRDGGRIAFQLAFQEHLLARGFPTSAVVRTRDDESSVFVEGLHWALFAFVEGQEFDFTRPSQVREAGKRLAEFETIAAGYRGPVAAPPVEEVGPEKWLAPVSSHIWRTSVLTTQHEEQLQELFGDGYEPELGFFRRWRREATKAWPQDRLAALPQAWLHCDYHGRNMVFQGDELAGLFDFDFVTKGPRTYDVSRSLFNFGRERRGSTVLREEFCRAFLEGFESLQPLSDEERQALPFMAAINWVPDAGFHVARREETGDPDIGNQLRYAVRMMEAMQSEMRHLAPQLGWNKP